MDADSIQLILEKEVIRTHKGIEKRSCEGIAICKPKRKASEETSPVDALISDF